MLEFFCLDLFNAVEFDMQVEETSKRMQKWGGQDIKTVKNDNNI